MREYKIVEISETHLEDLIRQGAHLIEDGLRYIGHQKSTHRGPLDVLMVDSGEALAVAELKVCEDDSMLMQGIDYYDYISKNTEGFSIAYKDFNINATQTPRLLLIAPSFSVNLLNRCKWIDIPISIFTYRCLVFEDPNELTPVFSEVTIPTIPGPVVTYNINDRFNYITNSEMRDLAKKVTQNIQDWDSKNIVVEPIKNAVSLKYSGRVFAYLAPRRDFFHIYTYDNDNVWTGYKINNTEDFEKLEPLLRANIKKKR
jgi:hypothetical protein